MRSPEQVLKALNKHGKVSDYKFERLYRILYNVEMFYMAYQRIYAKPGNMTPGSDGKTIDQMSTQRISRIIASLKDESYKPNPARRKYIPKKNGKKRPLGIPSFEDKLVQEVVRTILEAIYEEVFEDSSHGFRPNRSCHTALTRIQKTFKSTKWFIEGDIKGFFDNIDHNVLIGILRKRISDERFLRLIRKFLNAGYIENWEYHNTFSGTPQGGIISPILANIYLDCFDKYMEEYTRNFNKGKERHLTKEYSRLSEQIYKLKAEIESAKDAESAKQLKDKYEKLRRERLKVTCRDYMDDTYKRLKYTRYADDFLIGVIGSKADCIKIKSDITQYMQECLHLEMSQEKTLITNAQKPAKFLGYEIFVRKSNDTKRSKYGVLRRVFNKRIQLALGKDTFKKKLLEYRVLEIKIHNGKEYWKAKSRPKLSNNNDFEILDRYNKEIKGIYNYYCLANNCSSLSKLGYIMKYSMYKTFAQKYRTTMSQIRKKYTKNGLFSVRYYLKNGTTKDLTFYHGGFKKKNPMNIKDLDNLPKFTYHPTNTSLIDRLKAEKCELCGAVDKLVMHHVRKLKNLQGKTTCEKQMMARKRKTIAICGKCYKKLSNNG